MNTKSLEDISKSGEEIGVLKERVRIFSAIDITKLQPSEWNYIKDIILNKN